MTATKTIISFRNEVQKATREAYIKPNAKTLPSIELTVVRIKEAQDEATTALLQLVLDMIGDDEPSIIHTADHPDLTNWKAIGRNELRAELREKAEGLFK